MRRGGMPVGLLACEPVTWAGEAPEVWVCE